MANLALYEAVRNGMQSGDEILWAPASIIGWAIRAVTRLPASHTSLVVQLSNVPGRVFILESRSHGVELNLLSERLKHSSGKAWWRPLTGGLNPARDDIREHSLLMACECLDSGRRKQYDFLGCVSNVFGRVSKDARAFFCSEYAYCAIEAGVKAHAARTGYRVGVRKIVRTNMELRDKAPVPGDPMTQRLFLDWVPILEEKT